MNYNGLLISLPDRQKLRLGLNTYQLIIKYHPCQNPQETAAILRQLFNESFGLLPEQARYLLSNEFKY